VSYRFRPNPTGRISVAAAEQQAIHVADINIRDRESFGLDILRT
jgi:hypothetical protein